MRKKIRIGDLLVENKVISPEQLSEAIEEQSRTGEKLGAVLIHMGILDENQFLEFLSEQLGIPFVDLNHFQFDAELVKRLPETQARRFRAIALDEGANGLRVGMADPLDLAATDEILRLVDDTVEFVLVRESEILRSLDLVYRRTEDIKGFAGELEEELSSADVDLGDMGGALETSESDAPVVKMLTSLFEDAMQVGASDIHIEPEEKFLRLRQRVDGVLYEQIIEEKRVISALTLRIKLMAGLNIAEKRLPQDGRFAMKARGKRVDVRVSTLPVAHGEAVVMRLLDQSGEALNLDCTGMTPDMLSRFRSLIHMHHGMILVTGPTGSGKTTTLYGALSELNTVESKIVTAEDPVEYRMQRISQVQVEPKIGLDFAMVLRTALRQDPDIIMVGEVRDQETAMIALRAALTGHMVLATLHTNDAISSAVRLMDMGVESFMVATGLRAVIAQRLIRRICQTCKAPVPLTEQEKAWFTNVASEDYTSKTFYRGRGCGHCNNTGYRGRIGIYELLEFDEMMVRALRDGDVGTYSAQAAASLRGKTLLDAALAVAADGLTTTDEIFRVVSEQENLVVT